MYDAVPPFELTRNVNISPGSAYNWSPIPFAWFDAFAYKIAFTSDNKLPSVSVNGPSPLSECVIPSASDVFLIFHFPAAPVTTPKALLPEESGAYNGASPAVYVRGSVLPLVPAGTPGYHPLITSLVRLFLYVL